MERICKYCGEKKPIEDFVKNKNCKNGHSHKCKICTNEYYKSYRLIYSRQLTGIYKIQSKKIPDEIYIGSSKNIDLRKMFHFNLSKRKDRNYKLYHHIKEYGIDDLSLSILKLCNPEHLIYWEQYYISELNPYFNIHKFASEPNSKSNEARKFAFQDNEMDTTYFNKELQILSFLNEYSEEIIPFNIL